MVPTLLPAPTIDGQSVVADWDAHRFFWISGSLFTGKTTVAKAMVEDFEAQGGEALVFVDFAHEARHYATKLYTFSSERDMLPTLEEICDERLTADGEHAPLLVVIEDAADEVTEQMTSRFLQVARHARRLNAWVLATSDSVFQNEAFSDLEPERFHCVSRWEQHYIERGVKP